MTEPGAAASNGIGLLREKSLHAGLKAWYALPGDAIEVRVGSHVVDIVRGDLLIEVQTGGFTALRPKLTALLHDHPVRVVYPIAQERWIVTLSSEGEILRRRRSPKRGSIADVFRELVHIVPLFAHERLAMDVLFTREEEIRRHDGLGSWRRGGVSILDRRLLHVLSVVRLETAADLAALLPDRLPDRFTNAALAASLHVPRGLAQRCTYCLRSLGVLEVAGREGRALAFARVSAPAGITERCLDATAPSP
jgi:hypothetical protein